MTAPFPQPEFWGEAESLILAKEHISKAAKINRPILIIGERGTGKELAAARLHYLSPRWDQPYLTVNCAALNPNLVESELFGHEAGSFTGAKERKTGLFTAASGGTLFLDEISHLPLPIQAKLLRVVEYGTFRTVGSFKEQKTDVRLISASNRDLLSLAQQDQFLPDLYDRLSFDVIKLPPLRERLDDISLLAHRFAARMALELKLEHSPEFSERALKALEGHPWPGNVRELKNVVERAVYRASSFKIDEDDLFFSSPLSSNELSSQALADDGPKELLVEAWPLAPGLFDAKVAQAGLNLLDEALKNSKNNQKTAAKLLGMSYHRFRFLEKKYRTLVAVYKNEN